jgi:hypothetical protein
MITWSIARQQLGKHVSTAMYMHTTVKEFLGAVFFVRFMPRLYSEHDKDKLLESQQSRTNCEMVVGRQ